jgi:hypothetical protein
VANLRPALKHQAENRLYQIPLIAYRLNRGRNLTDILKCEAIRVLELFPNKMKG